MIGYIGFFDILGYQSFLKNNSDEVVQDEVLNFISSSENPNADIFRQIFPFIVGEGEPLIKNVLKRMQWLVFSDTIVFTLEQRSQDDEGLSFMVVLAAARNLMHKMFDYGMPLRGVLHYGQYKSVRHSMAGRGIVEAYEFAKDINLSTCVLTTKMMERFHDIKQMDEGLKRVFENNVYLYKTPLSTGVREARHNLASNIPIFVGPPYLREYVHNKFWAHGKDLGDIRAVEKVEETERFLLFCVMKQKEEIRKAGPEMSG